MPLAEDQAHLLNKMVDAVKASKPDCILIAGDIYDRAIPAPEAVTLLDDFLTRLVREYQKPIVVIAGNHDSADRLGYGSRLLADSSLHLVTEFDPAGRRSLFTMSTAPLLSVHCRILTRSKHARSLILRTSTAMGMR